MVVLSKKHIFKRLSIALIFLLVANLSFGAKFSVNAPRQVIQGNKFNISYILEDAEGSGFQNPDVEGCKLLYGPSTSRSMSTSIINGKMSSSSSETYVMTYRAEKEGTYKVGKASIIVDGKTYTTNPFTLQVLPPDKSASSGNQNQSVQIYDIDSQNSEKAINKNDVFVRIILSKNKVYEQEGVVCTIKLYTKYNIQQFMPTLQPSFNGFISQELPITSSINRVENYKGENYMVADLKQCILFPQQSGNLTITSGNYDLTVIQYEKVESFFGMMRRPVERSIQVKSNSASINIIPLPKPIPADFCGAVGKFNVKKELLKSSLKTNEAGTLRLTFTGQGNLKNINTPKIDFPTQFDVYDAQTTVDANPSGNTLTGSVTVDYAFVPQYVGKFTIPETTVSYFNPEKKSYEKLVISQTDLDIAKGTSSNSITNTTIKENKDILHIKLGNLNLSKDTSLIIDSWTYLLYYIIPLLLFVGILYNYRKMLKERANVSLMKNKRANKVAIKRLKTVRQYMSKKQEDKFYEEMLRTLWGYISDKLTIPVSELNRDNISAELSTYGLSEEDNKEFLSLLDDCEFARYAKSQTDSSMNDVYDKACDIILKVENVKKK